MFLPGDVLRRADGNDLTAAVANFGIEVDDPVYNLAYFAATGVSSNARPNLAASAMSPRRRQGITLPILCILKREVRRPTAFFFVELDLNLGGIFAFVDDFVSRWITAFSGA